MDYKNTKILVTGACGFVGFHLSRKLCEMGAYVVGVDNMNHYYDPVLKEKRLEILSAIPNFRFILMDIADKGAVDKLFAEEKFDYVVNLAAQAGVRYSIDHPDVYISSNLVGFYNILEAVRNNPVKHLVYASSSSVYGNSKDAPFRTDADVSNPISLYAATKKCNELLAHSYTHLYKIPSTGLRFFTVYGPFGRPDMAYFSFAEKMIKGETIKVFNNGDMLRDFTYIDDIVNAMLNIIPTPPKENENGDMYKVYNIGGSNPEKLMDVIAALEKALSDAFGRKIEATKEFLPMQPGDVYMTSADVTELDRDFGFKPQYRIEYGFAEFAKWFKDYKEGK